MSEVADALIEHCREAGQRITAQRRIIADVVTKAADYPDVSEIYRRAIAIDPGISLSTVYRTLKIFAATGLVERHSFSDGRIQFESASREHHDHLIDVDSGAVIAFRSDEIERLQTLIANELGYELTGHRFVLYGRRLAKRRQRRSRELSSVARTVARDMD